MIRYWNELEGMSLAGRYRLQECLNKTENDAWYLTRFEPLGDAGVRLIRADAPFAAEQLEVWREVMTIEHPHIVRMLDAGQANVEGTDLIYAVCEYPDDFLAAALVKEPLPVADTREVLDACLSALGYLHGRGFVHGGVAAELIMAIGDKIKLPCDSIRGAGARVAGEPEACEAPEVAAGGEATPASDMWGLGATLVEMLTRKRPVARSEVPSLPEPFATIVRNTMLPRPEDRWSVDQVQRYLRSPLAGTPVIPAPVAIPHRESQPWRRHGGVMKWVPLAGAIAAVGLGIWFFPHSKTASVRPVEPKVLPAPYQPERRAVPQMAPRAVPASMNPDAVWRVVLYEYAKRGPAQERVRRLNEKHPEWHAEVFAPRGDRRPYLVAIGGRMTRPEAERLRRRARSAGMPHDAFVRNYPR